MRVNDPVINGEGLVGKVAQVASDGAQVDLITDSAMGVSARDRHGTRDGLVQPKVGDPNDLLLQYLPASAQANTRRIRRHLRHRRGPATRSTRRGS